MQRKLLLSFDYAPPCSPVFRTLNPLVGSSSLPGPTRFPLGIPPGGRASPTWVLAPCSERPRSLRRRADRHAGRHRPLADRCGLRGGHAHLPSAAYRALLKGILDRACARAYGHAARARERPDRLPTGRPGPRGRFAQALRAQAGAADSARAGNGKCARARLVTLSTPTLYVFRWCRGEGTGVDTRQLGPLAPRLT